MLRKISDIVIKFVRISFRSFPLLASGMLKSRVLEAIDLSVRWASYFRSDLRSRIDTRGEIFYVLR
jgi:hypothetical protein